MNDKERLEEIKKIRETILEENDFRTRCVLASVFVGLGYMDYLIKQAERVQELEEDLTKYRNGFEFQLLINNSIKKQNKRYREAIEKAIEDLENERLWDALVRLKALEESE